VSYQICYQYPKQKDTHYSDFGMNATGVLTDSLSNSIYTPLAIIMHAFFIVSFINVKGNCQKGSNCFFIQ